MKKLVIDQNFRMRIAGTQEWVPAFVPGSVYGDLLEAGKIEDPYWRDNEDRALSLMEHDFEYEGVFAVEESFLEQDQIILRFEGLDTLADIYFNGEQLGKADNMHRIWEFDVTGQVHAGDNMLRILFSSPTRFIEEEYRKSGIGGSEDAMRGFPKIRKAHCMFGWDWGPRLPDAGIWREVSLIGITAGRFESIRVIQNTNQECAVLDLDISIRTVLENAVWRFGNDQDILKKQGYSCRITVTDIQDPQLVYTISEDEFPGTLTIQAPKLWWPNGYGSQDLYKIRVELYRQGILLDIWEKKIGLRTMTVVREKDEFGESFAQSVNGVRFFAMGADYIPEDNLLSRCTPERTRDLLLQCVAANYNSVRVWGGGHYPSDDFYEICDELGLVVWQDFMFACANYDLTDDFEANIRQEFIDNIRRIRHHASLGLWCGNNEMEMFVDQGIWDCTLSQKADYIKMYEYLIPKILKEEDPQTFYWPASPSSGGSFDAPNDENRGDVHYWDVWHGNKPFTEYRKFYFRYVSEFGFQSFPSLKTIETFTEPEDRNVFSYVMEKHQRNASANGKIMNYLEQTYLYPNSFDTLLYASQLLQAEAIRYGVEHFRRNRGRCMGAIVWQLNDCWPVASWSSIDYYGRWKALHYYEKRMFAPLMISCEEEGILTQDTNVNAQPFEVRKSIRLSVANETREDHPVRIRWELRNSKGEILRQGSEDKVIPALTSVWSEQTELSEARLYDEYVSFSLQKNEETISSGTVIFCQPKYFHFQNPGLSVRREGESTLVVTAQAYARSVEIRNAADDLILSDNFFDMNPGERRIEIIKGDAEELTLRSVYDIR